MEFTVKDFKNVKEDVDIACGFMLAARDRNMNTPELEAAYKGLAIACEHFLKGYKESK